MRGCQAMLLHLLVFLKMRILAAEAWGKLCRHIVQSVLWVMHCSVGNRFLQRAIWSHIDTKYIAAWRRRNGAVYKAKDVELNRVIALKTIRGEYSGNQAIIERFKQELILSTQVTHKSLAVFMTWVKRRG